MPESINSAGISRLISITPPYNTPLSDASIVSNTRHLSSMKYNLCCRDRYGRGTYVNRNPRGAGIAASEGDLVGSSEKSIGRLSHFPLVFIGLGLYRAWIEVSTISVPGAFPLPSFSALDIFEISAIATWVLGALLAKFLAPLSKRKASFVISGGLIALSTAAAYYAAAHPDSASFLALPISIGSGVGIAILILIWSEFYGCLNPLRVALYYSASIIVGALVIYLTKGLVSDYRMWFVIFLPVLSALFAFLSFRHLSEAEQPRPMSTRFSFPWKPVLLMAVFSFAYGLKESSILAFSGPHSSFGVIAAAAVVLIGVIAQGERFNFGLIYRFGLPLMVASFLIVPALGFPVEAVSAFCASLSYTAFSILIMLLLSNLSYRYGITALWLFGIERAIRQAVMLCGGTINHLLAQSEPFIENQAIIINVVIVLLIIVSTMILLSEKDLASNWGIEALTDKNKPEGAPSAKGESMRSFVLGKKCASISKHYALSVREAEVLLLLAQRKSIGAIEQRLIIANGTAKAHVRHIYQKLDIHSRSELFALLERTDVAG